MDQGAEPIAAVRNALQHLEGAFALGIIFAGQDDLMIAARKGSPLAIGHGSGEMYLGSDAIALAPFTDAITYLEEGDWAVLHRSGAEIFNLDGERVERPLVKAVASALLIDKGNYRHFMAKEIHEQPEVISHTLANYLDMTTARVRFRIWASISRKSAALRYRRVARLIMPGSSPNTGSSVTRDCRSTSMSRPKCVTARRRCLRTVSRFSSRSQAKRPIRWRRFAMQGQRPTHRVHRQRSNLDDCA